MAALALEIEHGVDRVLEQAGPCDLAVLGDVADQEQRGAAPLGEADQLVRAGAQLGHRARRRIDALDIHGLDRIDDHQAGRAGVIEGRDHVADRGRRRQLHRRAREAETRRAQPELVDRLLAADIGHGLAAARQRGAGLQRQGGLADAGIAADQDRRALDEAAAQHPVELLDAGGEARRRGGGAAQAYQLERAPGGAQALGDGLGCRLLGQAVPFAAGIATPRPLGVPGAATAADVTGIRSRHDDPMPRTRGVAGSTKQDFAAMATENPSPRHEPRWTPYSTTFRWPLRPQALSQS